MKRIIEASALLLLFACGVEDTDTATEADCIPHYELLAVDTVGIELGDSNYVFGLIGSVDFDHSGNMLVLDPATSSFSVFSPGGEFIARVGRAGSGPGEFLAPADLCILSSGAIAVSDPRGRLLSIFRPDYSFDRVIDGFYPSAPFVMQSAPGDAIVGYQRIIRFRDNQFGYALARWEEGPEPVVEYLSQTEDFNPEDIASSFLEDDIKFAVAGDGTVYAAVSSTDSWEVLGFSADGEEILSLERPFSPVEKTEEELEAEVEEFERMIASRAGGRHGGGGGRSGGGFGFEPEALKVAIAALFIDSEDRIWVRSGVHTNPWFDVFDEDGRELFTSSFDPGTDELIDMEVIVSPYGFAAFEGNPYSYPRVYILELDAPVPEDPERGTGS